MFMFWAVMRTAVACTLPERLLGLRSRSRLFSWAGSGWRSGEVLLEAGAPDRFVVRSTRPRKRVASESVAQEGITANTVGSALERLYRKGLASRWKVSHAYRYKATLGPDAFRARRVIEAAGGIRNLANGGLLAAFVDLVANTDSVALDQLEQLILEKREEGRS